MWLRNAPRGGWGICRRGRLVEPVLVDFHAKLTHHFHRILTHPDS